MTTALVTQSHVPAELQEKVLLGGDLAKLTVSERLVYYNAVCTSVGLNPLTRPFEYLMLGQGEEKKMVLYARKDCTDQLRDLHGVSVEIASREILDGVIVVTARAKNMTERTDESIGAVPIVSEEGEWKTAASGKRYFVGGGTYKPYGPLERANAIMKAETKAKRRVTLSICGLGMFDESEIDGVPDAKKLYHAEDETPHTVTRAEIMDQSTAPATGQQDGVGHAGERSATAGSMAGSPQQASDAAAPLKTTKPFLFNEILLDIDQNADWNTVKQDYKKEKNKKSLNSLTTQEQQAFLAYMREKIEGFPY